MDGQGFGSETSRGRMKKREGRRREEVVKKEREEEDNEVECKGWGTSGMSALPRVCVCGVCE